MDAADRRRLTADLIRLADGDRSAFDPVFDAAWPVLRAFCLRTLDDEAAAEDAAQQALLNTFARVSEFDTGREALPWLLGIATWECRKHLNRRLRRREDRLDQEPAFSSPTWESPEQEVISADLGRAVRRALAELSPVDAETLWTAVSGEIADRRVQGATFRKRLQRATARLRLLWRSRHGCVDPPA